MNDLKELNKKNGSEMINNLTAFGCEVICCIGITKNKEAHFELVLTNVDNMEHEVIKQLELIVAKMKKRNYQTVTDYDNHIKNLQIFKNALFNL